MVDSSSIFERNLHALQRRDTTLARRLAQTKAAPLAWSQSKTGPWTAKAWPRESEDQADTTGCMRAVDRDGGVRGGGRGGDSGAGDAGKAEVALGSRYDPRGEAVKLVGEIEFDKAACVVVLGVGLGYHISETARRLGDNGVLIVFEPEAATLRAVFERIDHTDWLARSNVLLVDAATDRTALTALVEPYAGVLTQGTQLLTHPPTRRLHPEAIQRFSHIVADTLAYCRTNIATALVNAGRTCSNLASNLGQYAAGATTDELLDAAKGCPAVCVGAGPSLVRNVDLLRDPSVRQNIVLITAQTTLKPLLDRHIRPDFVTALDYSPISQRFYEDLPDLPEVTLVAEPKAHPSILDSFPGPIRTTGSQFNDQLLGPLARRRTPLPSGATVAHLSYYLARHLGCDPVILIGQDLGFSDGLYYAPGTAVHQVWAGELNPFNTLEMMEWRRIVRHKSHLQRCQDARGQPIFSDEQMVTYLKQFERDFDRDTQAGRTVIDATEGGMPKAHTTRMTLAEALSKEATGPLPPLPRPSQGLDAKRIEAVSALLARRAREVRQLRQTTQQALPVVTRMRRHQRNSKKMNQLFRQMVQLQRRAEEQLSDAFALVNSLNLVGTFNRKRTDRTIAQSAGDSFDRQRQQIERDRQNLTWLAEACDEMLTILEQARERIGKSHLADPSSGC